MGISRVVSTRQFFSFCFVLFCFCGEIVDAALRIEFGNRALKREKACRKKWASCLLAQWRTGLASRTMLESKSRMLNAPRLTSDTIVADSRGENHGPGGRRLEIVLKTRMNSSLCASRAMYDSCAWIRCAYLFCGPEHTSCRPGRAPFCVADNFGISLAIRLR
jgi:hypothetical protein